MKNWNLKTCERLIARCATNQWDIEAIEEGVLGLGEVILTNHKVTIRIQEVFLNAWTSDHEVTMTRNSPTE